MNPVGDNRRQRYVIEPAENPSVGEGLLVAKRLGNLATVGSVRALPATDRGSAPSRDHPPAPQPPWSPGLRIAAAGRARGLGAVRASASGTPALPGRPQFARRARAAPERTAAPSASTSEATPARHSSSRASAAETRTTPAARPSSRNSSSGWMNGPSSNTTRLATGIALSSRRIQLLSNAAKAMRLRPGAVGLARLSICGQSRSSAAATSRL